MWECSKIHIPEAAVVGGFSKGSGIFSDIMNTNKSCHIQMWVKQAQEFLAAAMSLSDISGIVTSWADCYKNSTPNFNFSL